MKSFQCIAVLAITNKFRKTDTSRNISQLLLGSIKLEIVTYFNIWHSEENALQIRTFYTQSKNQII